MEKEKVVIYKKLWFWIIVILIIIVVFLFTMLITNSSNKGVGTAGISKQEFDEIKIGTTNFELNNIIDKNNEWENDEVYDRCVEKIGEKEEDSKYTYIYKYYGEKAGYAIITLQADYSNGYFYNDVIVIEKEDYNLK